MHTRSPFAVRHTDRPPPAGFRSLLVAVLIVALAVVGLVASIVRAQAATPTLPADTVVVSAFGTVTAPRTCVVDVQVPAHGRVSFTCIYVPRNRSRMPRVFVSSLSFDVSTHHVATVVLPPFGFAVAVTVAGINHADTAQDTELTVSIDE